MRFDERQLGLFRIILGAIGVAIWGYGYRTNDADVRLAGIGVLFVTLVLRWVPKGWLDGPDGPR